MKYYIDINSKVHAINDNDDIPVGSSYISKEQYEFRIDLLKNKNNIESSKMKIARLKEQFNDLDLRWMKAQEKMALNDPTASDELLKVIREKEELRNQIRTIEGK